MNNNFFEGLHAQLLSEVEHFQQEQKRASSHQTRTKLFALWLGEAVAGIGFTREDFARELKLEFEFVDALLDGLVPESEVDDDLLEEIAPILAMESNILRIVAGRDTPPNPEVPSAALKHIPSDPLRDSADHLITERRSTQGDSFSASDDPYREHIINLYRYLEEELLYLNTNASSVLSLSVTDCTEALSEQRPHAYRVSRPSWIKRPAYKPKRYEDLTVAYHNCQTPILILGSPGSGKTSMLMKFAYDRTLDRLNNAEAKLPVYSALRDWDGEQEFVDWLGSHVGLETEGLRKEIRERRVLLVLDGLDELITEAAEGYINSDKHLRLLQCLTEIDPVNVVMSCRLNVYSDLVEHYPLNQTFKTLFVLNALTDHQIRSYAGRRQDLWTMFSSDPPLLEMLRVPLALVVFERTCLDREHQLADFTEGTDEAKISIFQLYIQRRYEFEFLHSGGLMPFTLDQLYERLGHLAFLLLNYVDDQSVETFTDRFVADILGDESAVLLQLAKRMQLIDVSQDNSYQFTHPLIQEHFLLLYYLSSMTNTTPNTLFDVLQALERIGGRESVRTLFSSLRRKSRKASSFAAHSNRVEPSNSSITGNGDLERAILKWEGRNSD